MARKALGNDPFARGAVGRIPSSATPGSPIRRLSTARPPRQPMQEKPPPRSPSSTEVIARELLETTGARVRRFMESSLPALIEGVTRSAIDTLGLTALPVAVSEVDDFGMSLEFVERWQPVLARVLFNYFRAELLGLDKLPANGPAVLVCNHGGVLPYDEVLLKVAVRAGPPGGQPGRDIRPLSEDFAINAPFAGSFLNRFGLVRASPDNAERLLHAGHAIAVFPEGARGIAKLYRNRHRLQRFGRGGFVRLALRAGAPIYPVVLLGGDEAQPVLAKVRLPKPLQPPSQLPITPTFPWLGPVGLLPLPVSWTVQVGDPIVLDGGAAAAEDQSRVARATEEVRDRMQAMLGALLAKRRG